MTKALFLLFTVHHEQEDALRQTGRRYVRQVKSRMLAQDEIGAWPSSCAEVTSSATISLDVAFDPKSAMALR